METCHYLRIGQPGCLAWFGARITWVRIPLRRLLKILTVKGIIKYVRIAQEETKEL